MLENLLGDAAVTRDAPDLGEGTVGSLFDLTGPSVVTPQLVVIGDTGIDFFVAIDRMPARDSKVIGPHLGVFGGGMAANFAAAAIASFPELHVRLVSRVGGDDWGAATLKQLVDLGVDTTSVTTDHYSATWWCAVGLDNTGEKALMGGRTPASLPTLEDFRPDAWQGASWMHVLGDIQWSNEAIDAARRQGALTSVDVEGSFTADFPERARQLVMAADLAILNLSGIAGLGSPGQDLGIVLEALSGGPEGPRSPKGLLVTLGAEGALFVHRPPGGQWRYFGHQALKRRVIDTTGAGDAFAGTFVASLLRGASIRKCMSYATAAGAKTIERLGSRGPRLDEYRREETND